MQTHVSIDLPATLPILAGHESTLARLSVAVGFVIAATIYAAGFGGD